MKPYTIEVCPQGDKFIATVPGASPVFCLGNTIKEAVEGLKVYVSGDSWIPREVFANAGLLAVALPQVTYKKSILD